MMPVAVTNNSLIHESMSDKKIFSKMVFDSECSSEEVLKISKSMIISGHKLLINPFFGVVPSYESPFKTIVLSECGNTVDFYSLNIIDCALKKIRRENAERMKPIWDKNGLDCFKKGDLVVIERWLSKIYTTMNNK